MSDKIPKTITLETPAKVRMPTRVAAKIDAFYRMRESRLGYSKEIKKAEKVLSALKGREEEVALELAAELRKMGASKMSGETATFSPGEIDVFTVDDWDLFYQYIIDNDAFDCLERRPARGALKDRLEDDELPNGIKADKKFNYSLVKASQK